MRFSEAWLREWTSPDVTTSQLVKQLTMAGLEVDSVEPAAPGFSQVVIGQVRSARPHPDAQKLTLCEVDGGDRIYPIVCGAVNVRPDLKVALARVGAVLPDGTKIKTARLRGEESSGMLCSAAELGLAEQSEGLLELPDDAPLGVNLRDWLHLDDHIIEVDLTPNRADCLSIRGLAREVSVLNGIALGGPDLNKVEAVIEDARPVSVGASDACPRYLGRVIRRIHSAAQTPIWMKEKLRRSGLRSLGPVVDVTNYVLLELGQPLHAFDLDQLNGAINVRFAKGGERLTLLDGREIVLAEQDLVIADKAGPLALAGIMGGASSAVTEQTRDVFLECAFFSPSAIAGRARAHGLHTDSSHRFERGVDPQLQYDALERATALLIAIAGGEPGPIGGVEGSDHLLSMQQEISLEAAHVSRVLGVGMAAVEIEDILGRLGMEVTTQDEGDRWTVLAPGWRFDIAIAEDLIEELARVKGYDHLPSRLPRVARQVALNRERCIPMARFSDLLVARGYQEIISYSFVDADLQALLAPDLKPLALQNPLSADLAVMRSTLWAGLIRAAQWNMHRQVSRLRLFEAGLRFLPEEHELVQDKMLAGLAWGGANEPHWGEKTRNTDYFDLKGDVEALLAVGGALQDYRFVAESHVALHPGQSARIYRHSDPVGWIGQLHPSIGLSLGLDGEIFVFELKYSSIMLGNVPKCREISDFPSVRRDLAVVVASSVPGDGLLRVAAEAGGEILRDIRLFDIYQGPGIPENCKSIALGLTFQDGSRTLNEAEINDLVAKVVSQLKQEFKAALRE